MEVLVVAGDPARRATVQAALHEDGRFRVLGEAVTAVEAIELAADFEPDIVLMEFDLPGTTGLDALPLLRVAAPQAAVVMWSPTPTPDLSEEIVAMGAAGYIAKIDLTALPDAVFAAVRG
jgi:DNA-binding NarL/FixJ family response regulator